MQSKQLELFKRSTLDERIDALRVQMVKDDVYLIHCVRLIFAQQTKQEQRCSKVLKLNNRGFMRCDVAKLTHVAITGVVEADTAKRMLKYARQCLKLEDK